MALVVDPDLLTSPIINCGVGAPNHSQPVGSIFLRLDPVDANSRIYIAVDTSGTWTPIPCAS